jgi:hypothetical protein
LWALKTKKQLIALLALLAESSVISQQQTGAISTIASCGIIIVLRVHYNRWRGSPEKGPTKNRDGSCCEKEKV